MWKFYGNKKRKSVRFPRMHGDRKYMQSHDENGQTVLGNMFCVHLNYFRKQVGPIIVIICLFNIFVN